MPGGLQTCVHLALTWRCSWLTDREQRRGRRLDGEEGRGGGWGCGGDGEKRCSWGVGALGVHGGRSQHGGPPGDSPWTLPLHAKEADTRTQAHATRLTAAVTHISYGSTMFVCSYHHRLTDIPALTLPFITIGQRERSTHPACAAAKNGWEAIPRGDLKKEAAGGSTRPTLAGFSSSAHMKERKYERRFRMMMMVFMMCVVIGDDTNVWVSSMRSLQ